MKNIIIIPAIAALALAACGSENEAQPSTQGSAPTPGEKVAPAPTEKTPESLADQGRKRFSATCTVCHTVNDGDPSRVGPNLFGIVGKTAGASDDFAYSDAVANAEIVWTEENLDAFIENPQTFLRGNRMAFAGERNAENRAAIIVYLKTLK